MKDYSYYEEMIGGLLRKTGLPFVKLDSFEIVIRSAKEREYNSFVNGSFRIDTGEANICCCEPYTEKLGKFKLTKDNSDPDWSDIGLEFGLTGSSDRHIMTYCRGDCDGSEHCSYSKSIKRGFKRTLKRVF
jgi:hypothetical protein